MRVPIIYMDGRPRDFAAAFRSCFSKPPYRYFEIVLLLCQETKTLTSLVRQVAVQVTLSTAVIMAVLAQAQAEEVPVGLQVLKVNPARRLACMSGLASASSGKRRCTTSCG